MRHRQAAGWPFDPTTPEIDELSLFLAPRGQSHRRGPGAIRLSLEAGVVLDRGARLFSPRLDPTPPLLGDMPGFVRGRCRLSGLTLSEFVVLTGECRLPLHRGTRMCSTVGELERSRCVADRTLQRAHQPRGERTVLEQRGYCAARVLRITSRSTNK